MNPSGGSPRPPSVATSRHLDANVFRLLVESTTDYAIIMLDADGNVASWNAGAARIKGYRADEIIGQHFSVFYPPDAIERNWPATELEIATREGRFEEEGWRLRKDGTRFWANVVITPLRDESGKLVGFGKVSRDLTERRRAEQQLRESEERLRLIIDSTIDYAIFMLDTEGRIVSWNQGAERIKGYRPDEIIGRHFSTFYTPEAVASQWPEFELTEALRVGRFEDEGWRLRKDGSRFWANVIITALHSADGTHRGFAKVTRDLTSRKEHQERIANLTRELEQRVNDLDAANRELAQRNAENESFVYSVSHDLRSPLVNLQGFSQELRLTSDAMQKVLRSPGIPDDVRKEAETLLAVDMQESISFIRTAVKHLGSIIDGLLRLSRVGRIEYEAVPVDVGAVVTDILSAMHTTIAASRARVVLSALPEVIGDRNAIGQVFANLIGNALKSFDENRPGVLEISASDTNPAVFAISDNGIGISPEYHAKLFHVFQQVHKSRSHGEGMGLAIVRRIVERHGGRIWLQSQPDVGTTFFFTLAPAAPKHPESETK